MEVGDAVAQKGTVGALLEAFDTLGTRRSHEVSLHMHLFGTLEGEGRLDPTRVEIHYEGGDPAFWAFVAEVAARHDLRMTPDHNEAGAVVLYVEGAKW